MLKAKIANNSRRLNKVLKGLPFAVQKAAFDAGLRPAAKVVQRRAAELAPDSVKSGSRKGWSKKIAESRSLDEQLKDVIKIKVIRSSTHAVPYAMVGPERPAGNVAHFVSPLEKTTRDVVYWGEPQGTTAPKDDDFMRRAFDETQSQQARAFVRGTIKRVRKELENLGRG